MVRGHAGDYREADKVLDELVRQTFLFLKEQPTHVARRQPEGSEIERDYDRELTDTLVKAGLLSEGYVAVISGTQAGNGGEFEGGDYRLAVHTVKGRQAWEQGRINASLDIRLKPGTEPGIENAVGEYSVGGSKAVFFEEENRIIEGWSGTSRPINLSQKSVQDSPGADSSKPDDVLAYKEGNRPLDGKGMPIPNSLFPGARSRLPNHPKGTRYEADRYQILCYFPKEAK